MGIIYIQLSLYTFFYFPNLIQISSNSTILVWKYVFSLKCYVSVQCTNISIKIELLVILYTNKFLAHPKICICLRIVYGQSIWMEVVSSITPEIFHNLHNSTACVHVNIYSLLKCHAKECTDISTIIYLVLMILYLIHTAQSNKFILVRIVYCQNIPSNFVSRETLCIPISVILSTSYTYFDISIL